MKPRPALEEVRPIEGALGRLGLCQGVSAETLRQLAFQARMLRAVRGETLVRRGERPAGVFAVVHGSVKARLQHEDGDEVILALLGPGSTFGTGATVLGHASKLDLVALEESLLLEIGAAALSAQMRRDPRLARNLANALAARVQALVTTFEQGMQPAVQRLASYLDSIAQPTPAPDVWTARLSVSKTVLAARLGMQKETLSRLLARLAKRGLIRIAQRDITILDRAGLRKANSGRAHGA